MNDKEERYITLKLSSLVKLVLRGDYSYPIPYDVAEIVEGVSKDTTICHVQYRDKYDPKLNSPVLWNWHRWRESIDSWEKAKKKSEDERVMKFIFDENVKRVSKHCERFLLMDNDFAIPTAYKLVKDGRFVAMRTIGVNNLVSRIEEI